MFGGNIPVWPNSGLRDSASTSLIDLACDLSRSLIVNLDSPCRISYLCLTVTYRISRLFYETFKIGVTLTLTFQDQSRLNLMVQLDFPYTIFC